MYQNRLGPSGGIYYPDFAPCFVVLYPNKVLGIVIKEPPDVSKNILLKKPKKILKPPIENCNPTTEVTLMCITYSWYVDGVMYPEIFQSSRILHVY